MTPKNSPIVPTKAWKAGLTDVYAPVLEALQADSSAVSTQNDGSIYVDVETSLEAIEDAGAYALSDKATKRGWHIVTDEGMAYAQAHHPSEGRVQPTSAKRELTPEEIERAERRKALRERMNAIRDAQADESQDD